MKDFYDQLYMQNPAVFGDTSSALLDCVFGLIPLEGGTALDLGAGAGHASMSLASKGFAVTAVDLSDNAFSAISTNSVGSIRTITQNIIDFEMTDDYTVVCSFFLFHHVERQAAIRLIRRIQDHTVVGGVNIFRMFTQESNFFTSRPKTPNFYVTDTELVEIYDGWDILIDEREASMAAVGGSTNTVQSLVARRLV